MARRLPLPAPRPLAILCAQSQRQAQSPAPTAPPDAGHYRPPAALRHHARDAAVVVPANRGPTTYAGKDISSYLAWHPLDHITGSSPGPPRVEASGREPVSGSSRRSTDGGSLRRYHRDRGEARRHRHPTHGGSTACRRPAGTHVVGLCPGNPLCQRPGPGREVTPPHAVLPQPEHQSVPCEDGVAWVVHNVEEVGVLEDLLPERTPSTGGFGLCLGQ